MFHPESELPARPLGFRFLTPEYRPGYLGRHGRYHLMSTRTKSSDVKPAPLFHIHPVMHRSHLYRLGLAARPQLGLDGRSRDCVFSTPMVELHVICHLRVGPVLWPHYSRWIPPQSVEVRFLKRRALKR